MNKLKENQLYNFIDSRLLPKVTTSAQCTEHYEVENLISDNFLARSRGFVANTTTRPPVEITFELLCPINIQYIILSRNLNHDHSITVEILTKCGRGNFTSISYENFTSNGILICNPQKHPPSNIDQLYSIAYFKSHSLRSFSTADWVKIKIVKTHRSVPCLGRIEIWGKVSKVCSEETLKAVRHLMGPKMLSLEPENLNDIAAKDFEIPDDFKDALTFEVMAIPVTLPSGNTVDQTTLDKCVQNDLQYGRTASDPFTGQSFTGVRKPVLNVALKHRIDMFLLQNAHRKETFGIQRTIGSTKRKIEENPVTASKVAVYEKSAIGLNPDETLNLAIERIVNGKRFIRFTEEKSNAKKQNECEQCKSTQNLYVIPCNHCYCRNCLLFIYKTLKCGLCEKNFDKSDPKRLHI